MVELESVKKFLKLKSRDSKKYTINIIVQNKASILLEYLKLYKTNFNIIVHKKDSKLKTKINKNNINNFIVINSKSDQEFSDILLKHFSKKNNFFFLNLANKIFFDPFLNTHKKKIINFHPSYLPEHKGLNAFKKAYKTDLRSGASVHFINKKIDGGKIILRKRYLIDRNKSFKFNRHKIFEIQFKQFCKIVESI